MFFLISPHNKLLEEKSAATFSDKSVVNVNPFIPKVGHLLNRHHFRSKEYCVTQITYPGGRGAKLIYYPTLLGDLLLQFSRKPFVFSKNSETFGGN